MSKLLSRHSTPDDSGKTQHITPASAGWKHVGFEVYHLQSGQSLSQQSGEQEVCLVLMSGKADVTTRNQSWSNLGERMSVFEDKAAYAVYVSNSDEYTVTATTALELAICRAPGFGNHAARLLRPETMSRETRGTGPNTRHVCNILPETAAADSLLVVEVITPNGNWSSYPPHKHDADNLPEESFLEETYYHRLNPPQGFAFQRVYTDDGSLDETMSVHDGDVVMVPRGYHPVGAPHGYDLYYLNVMAGPKRVWHFKNAPEHEWIVNQQ
jgi:5-deoxy-glucuronate isomerase